MIRFDSIDSTPNDNQPARLRVLLPGEELSGNDAQVRAQLLRSDQRAQAFDVDTPLVVTPTGEIHYKTSLAASEHQPQLQIARRLPRVESAPTEEQQIGLSPEQQQLLVALPWKFIEQAAQSEEVGWENCGQLFYTLSTREKHVTHRRKLQKMLLSDRQEDLDAAEQELMKLPSSERREYAFWLFESKDQDVINLALRLAASLHLGRELFIRNVAEMGGPKPLIRPPQLLLEVAQEYPEAIPSPEFFERYTEMVDKGTRGGRYEVIKPSRFETLIRKVVEPLGEMKVNLRTWNSMMRRVDELVDVVRYGTETLQIDQPSAVETILESLSNILNRPDIKPESSIRTWDLLAKFVIPESLVPQTLEMMIQTGDTDHTLAFFLLSRLPEDHPLLVEQREKAELLRTLCEGNASEVAARFEEIVAAQAGLISAFPDAIPHESVGFDYEFLPQIAGLKTPYGMEMGIDGGYTMPELRCIPDEQILQYTQEWRQRQFGVWLWSKTAQSREVSIHIHADHSENYLRQKVERYIFSVLFGRGYSDYHYNTHPKTHEVRSALEGYGQDQVKGFPDGLNYFPLAELLVALKNSPFFINGTSEDLPPEVAERGALADRFFNICRLTPSVEARAAAIPCLLSHFGTRIRKTENARERMLEKNWMITEAAEMINYEQTNFLELRMKNYQEYLNRQDIYSALFFVKTIFSWVEVYESDQQRMSEVLETVLTQLEQCFQQDPSLRVDDEDKSYLWEISACLARFPLPTAQRVHYLLRLSALPFRTEFSTQKNIFETLSFANDLTEAELNQVINKMLELATEDRDEALSALLNYLPSYPLSRDSIKSHWQTVRSELQPLFDEEIDRDKFRELRQVQHVSFLKIAQAICETEAEFIEYFKVIARTISAKELALLLQSGEYWFTPETHLQLIRQIVECGLGYKTGELNRFYADEEMLIMKNLLESCDRLVTDKDGLFAVIDLLTPEGSMKNLLAYTILDKVVLWIKKIGLSHREVFKYLKKKSIALASQFLNSWDELQAMPEVMLKVQHIPHLVNDLKSSAQWKKIVYSE